MAAAKPPPVRESCDIRDTILEWKLELIDLDNFQTIKVSRRPESLWEHSLRCFQRSSFDVRKLLKVKFRNESGQDEGGLRREFLEILFRQMLCSSLLKDTGDGYEVISNMIGMVDRHFHTFGKMLGTILIQGGPVSPAFSHMMINYGLKGLDSATVDSVQDANCKNIISKIQDADYPEHLMEDESVMNVLEAAGICTILNPKTKSSIVKALILSNSDILRKQPMLDAFWEGAECVGLKTKSYYKINKVSLREFYVTDVVSHQRYLPKSSWKWWMSAHLEDLAVMPGIIQRMLIKILKVLCMIVKMERVPMMEVLLKWMMFLDL
ncbi:uncharacterized protein LOC127705517 [Mytilus californianus]|uniref:uncharacterized protein LOC127705517 n=1 Tax=Mytilus californianus TaxID=6549 RepID=UPI0022479246|nr:uncharacterized protein LOC127705517 [Mytilus californianus]